MESPEPATAGGLTDGEVVRSHRDGGGGDTATVNDVSRKRCETTLFDQEPSFSPDAEGLYIYSNLFHLVPASIAQFASNLKNLRFFANEIRVLPPECGDLIELECLQIKIPSPSISGVPFDKLVSLKELEVSVAPAGPSPQSILGEIAALKSLTRLSFSNFSIAYIAPGIGCLENLQHLDLSFNELERLPIDIGDLSALKSLSASNNKLVGLPSGISSLSRLEDLDLSCNRLTSMAPVDLDSLRALRSLNLRRNKIPQQLCSQFPSWVSCDLQEIGSEEDDIAVAAVDLCCDDIAVGAVDLCCEPRLRKWHRLRPKGKQIENELEEKDSSPKSKRQSVVELGYPKRSKSEGERSSSESSAIKDDNSDNREPSVVTKPCLSLDDDDAVGPDDIDHSRHHSDSRNEDSTESAGLGIDGDTFEQDCLPSGSASKFIESRCDDGNPKQSLSNFKRHSDVELDNPKPRKSALSLLKEEDSSSVAALKDDKAEDGDGRNVSATVELSLSLGDDTVGTDDGNDSAARDCICSNDGCTAPDYPSSASLLPGLGSKFKRRYDEDIDDNPKPSKSIRPVNKCSDMSIKYSTQSFCGAHDYLPDGFYDVGRSRPFMSLEDCQQTIPIDSREVILVDREKDEELDAIAFSAQALLCNCNSSSHSSEDGVNNLERASMLALFVSDCFGGSDRSASVMRVRRSVVGSKKLQPFICTCVGGVIRGCGNKALPAAGSLNLADLCERSLKEIKESLDSCIVPIGALTLGVCRHRAVLMKYLCDRADPPIPCELVRGYLEFMPHAWNVILVRRGESWLRMVVDSCYPTDIREEIDQEYFCRYIPLVRHGLLAPLVTDTFTVPDESLETSRVLLNHGTEKARCYVAHCEFGNVEAAVKVRKLDVHGASEEEIRLFECSFLGEVRMLGALRKHRYIVEIYSHQLSSEWDRSEGSRLLQSMIVMEYVKGGSLKNYLERLSAEGKSRVPAGIALCIARDVACALVEVHSKCIIHRDIKSNNILIDLESGRAEDDAVPVVKLADFDSSVPLHSSLHTCCIAHLGIQPPDVCVGTPRWMAPEVLQAMNPRKAYGLEVDIWSFGCLLLELLTLRVPYMEQSDEEIYDCLKMNQRPRLTQELEELSTGSDEPTSRSSTEAGALKLLVGLFYQCTRGNPAERPTAKDIYDELCGVSTRTELRLS